MVVVHGLGQEEAGDNHKEHTYMEHTVVEYVEEDNDKMDSLGTSAQAAVVHVNNRH